MVFIVGERINYFFLKNNFVLKRKRLLEKLQQKCQALLHYLNASQKLCVSLNIKPHANV